MAFETERKFLVVADAWDHLTKPVGIRVRQGYIADTDKGNVRVRIMGNEAYITVKGKAEGFTRPEFEYPIPLHDAEEILDRLKPNEIIKTRYHVAFKGKTWDVDVFGGGNTGLVLAEIELADESEEFEKPLFVGEEVTFDRRYSNTALARVPYSSW
jgi:CYTH domain-containing protein